MHRGPSRSALFSYTTLFRSDEARGVPLLAEQAVGVDEKGAGLARHAAVLEPQVRATLTFHRADKPRHLLRASRSARHNRSGVTGMSRSVMPAGRTASRIAFMVAPKAPEAPDSPTPLAPSAFAWVCTGCSSQRIARIPSARAIGDALKPAASRWPGSGA